MTGKHSIVSFTHVYCTSLLDVSNIIYTISPFEIEKLADTHLHIQQKQYHQHTILVQINARVVSKHCKCQNNIT